MRAPHTSVIAGFTLLALAAFVPAASADVELSIHDGRVTIVAKDATVRQILTEWARVGRTKIVNVERLHGGAAGRCRAGCVAVRRDRRPADDGTSARAHGIPHACSIRAALRV